MERVARAEETRQALETGMTHRQNSALPEPPPLVPNLVTPTQTWTSPSSSQPPLQLLQPSLVSPTQASTPHSSKKRKQPSTPNEKLQLCHNFSSSFRAMIKKKRLKSSSKVFAQKNSRNAGKGKKIHAYGKYGVNSTIRRGAEIFAQCKRYHLTVQKRSETDQEHLAFLDKLSGGGSISMRDLRLYKQLSHDDLTNGKDDWLFAPVLVATNREHVDICERKSFLFAKEHSTYIFKWKKELSGWKNKPSYEQMEGVVHADSCFWETFVPHAEGFLSSNINNHLGLVNGTPIKYHSMSFSSEHELQLVCERMRKKPLGSVIILYDPPLAIKNISLPKTFDTKKQLSTKRKAQHKILKDLSLCDHDIVIPIKKRPSICKWQTFTIKKGNTIDVATVTARQHFPIELAFSMTVHKAQG
jgi:hypothetical protein